jgi:hypothetical protein
MSYGDEWFFADLMAARATLFNDQTGAGSGVDLGLWVSMVSESSLIWWREFGDYEPLHG